MYIYLAALSQTVRITQISAFPLELFPSDAMEDALQNVCGLQRAVCGVHSKGRIQRGGLTFLQQGVYKLQRSVFENI